MENLTFINSQFAYYFEKKIARPDGLHIELNSHLGSIFDATPRIESSLPDDERLKEVPIVQLSGNDEVYNLNLARSRADFFLNNRHNSSMSFAEQKHDFMTKVAKTWEFFERKNIAISWIGFVVTSFVETENPAHSLSKLLKDVVKEVSRGETSEVSMRYSSKIDILGIKSNDALAAQHGTAKFSESEKPRTGIFIMRDFNTKPTKQLKLSSKDVEKFIGECEKKFALEQVVEQIC